MKRIYLQKAKSQVARTNTIRDINKQIVLNYIRERAPISRAEISRETELQRSTVSAIVDSLQTMGLIEEIGAGDSTGGRKPTLLKLRTKTPAAIGVDVTPKVTTVALADINADVIEKTSFPTTSNSPEMTSRIVEAIKELAKKSNGYEVEVGISIPGIADTAMMRSLYIPYFQWENWDVSEKISEATNLKVTIDNDANATALAELWFGGESIRRKSNIITVLVGEGIGTGIVYDGQIYRGEDGAAGEFGHMIVGSRAPVPCSCGSYECWEAHASELALVSRFRGLRGKPGDEIGAEEIIALANEGNETALTALKETTRYLGIGISNLVVGLSPQAVIVSGNITKAWPLISQELDEIVRRSVRQELPKMKMLASSLGRSPTLVGAFSLVLARKFASAK